MTWKDSLLPDFPAEPTPNDRKIGLEKPGSIKDLMGLLHDPARKPLSDDELEQAIRDATTLPEPED